MDLEELEKDPRPFIQEWIDHQPIDWTNTDPGYWRTIFRRAREESKMPPSERQVCPPPPKLYFGAPPKKPDLSERTRTQRWTVIITRIVFRVHRAGMTVPESMTLSYNEPRDHVEWIRRIRYIERARHHRKLPRTFTSPSQEYGLMIGSRLESEIDRLRKEIADPCIDNIRWAHKASKGDLKRYYRAKKFGCCGFADEEVRVLGQTFLIGMNYGH